MKPKISHAANRVIAMPGFLFTLALALGCFAGSASAQTLNLHLVNSSTYADSDVWFTFTAAGTGAFSGTVAPANSIDATYAGGANIGQAVPMLWSNSYTYVTGGSTVNSVQNTWWSQSVSLASLENGSGFAGFQVTKANSPRVYVSLGAPLAVVGTGTLQNRGVLTNGTPSLSGTADPNFNTRWDQFELTVTPAAGDQGDITAINAIAIPMKMQSFIGSTPVQSTQNTTNWETMASNLISFVNSNAANNSYTEAGNTSAPVIYNGSGTTVNDLLRIIGVNNGAHAGFTPTAQPSGTIFTPAGGAGNIASIGAQPAFQDYVNHVATGTFVTPVEDAHISPYNGTAANAFFGFSGSTYAQSWTSNSVISASWLSPVASNTTIYNSGTLTSSVTGGSGNALVMEGYLITSTVAANGIFPATGTLGKYKMIIPPDGGVSGSSFLLSSFLYASDASANYGGIFEYTPMSQVSGGTLLSTSTYLYYQDFTSAIQLASGSLVQQIASNTPTAGQQMISQVVHDVAAGYNLGLVSSTVVDPATQQTFNNEGSLYWTGIWEAIKGGGSVNFGGTVFVSGTGISSSTVVYVGTVPLYTGLQPTGSYFNQWAYQIYQSSTSGYGNPYSDYLQNVDVNLLSSPNGGGAYDITDVVVTIIPEASTWVLLLTAGAVFALMKHRKEQRTAKHEARG